MWSLNQPSTSSRVAEGAVRFLSSPTPRLALTHTSPPGLSRNGPVFGLPASPRVSDCAIDQGDALRSVGSTMSVIHDGRATAQEEGAGSSQLFVTLAYHCMHVSGSNVGCWLLLELTGSAA
jgi:hypothetical protein